MRICLDHGHAVTTPGKRSPDGSYREYEFNRAVTAIMKRILEPYMEVIYSVDPNLVFDKSLTKRCKTANDAKADLFVSIHTNAAGKGKTWTSAQGWEVYVCAKGGKAEQLAQSVSQSVSKNITGIKNRGVKTAHFTVLTNTSMPAILIESGFHDNKDECNLLKTKEYREKLALAYCIGILNFLGIQYVEPEKIEPQKSSYEGYFEANSDIMIYKNNKYKLPIKVEVKNGYTLIPIVALEHLGFQIGRPKDSKQIGIKHK